MRAPQVCQALHSCLTRVTCCAAREGANKKYVGSKVTEIPLQTSLLPPDADTYIPIQTPTHLTHGAELASADLGVANIEDAVIPATPTSDTNQPESALPPDSEPPVSYETMTRNELQALCVEFGIAKGGNKQQLLNRLQKLRVS